MTTGNPYFGKTDTTAYKEACAEMATGAHIQRMNILHVATKDDLAMPSDDDA